MSVDVLPSYSPEVLPGYELSPTASCSAHSSSPVSRSSAATPYYYISEHIDLDLGRRKWGTVLPCYGRNGVVKGVVTIRSLKHVDRVVVRLVGKSVTSHIINSIPTLSQTRTFWHRSVELWSSAAASGSGPHVPLELPFSLTFDQHLPPSLSIQLRKANAYIAYAVRVDMYRRGMHMHEAVQTQVLHLPRTTSRYVRPFVPTADPTNEKRRQMTPSQWRRISNPNPAVASPSLLLPSQLAFPAGEAIPFIVPNASKLPAPIPDVELLRTRSVQTRAGLVQTCQTVARVTGVPEPGLDMLRGEIKLADLGKEVSCEVSGTGSIGYEIRFGDIVQAVEIVSHEWTGERSAGLPALELEAAGRRALCLVDMSV